MGFFDGGARSLSFGKMGDDTWLNRWRGGVIVDVREETQQTDWNTKAPIFADPPHNTKPKMQLPIVLKCDGQGPLAAAKGAAGVGDERTDPTDDGRRVLYVKGTLRFDIGDALRKAEADPNNLIGGELYMRFTGTRSTPSGTGRMWEVMYFPPPAGSQAGAFFAQQPEQPQAPVAPQFAAPPQQPAQAPAVPAAGASPWGTAPAAQQAPQAPPQGSPFGSAVPPAAPAQAPSNNPFGA